MSPPDNGEPAAWDVELKEQSRSIESTCAGLEPWLRHRLDDPGAAIHNPHPPAGTGVANETLIFDLHRTSGAVEGYVARLATADPLYLDFDLAQHFRMYEAMTAFPSVPTPAVVGYDDDPAIVGTPFFVMERIDGVVPTDAPSWTSEGFIVDASPAQRRSLWEQTVRIMCALHQLPVEPFTFLRTGATTSGAGDCLDYWRRYRRWAEHDRPGPLLDECEDWLAGHRPDHTALSWGDSRLPNIIYRDLAPVGLLDWDLVSLAGPQCDLAWWIIMDPTETAKLDGIGTADDLIDLWQDTTGLKATDLHWYLVFGAYRLGCIFTKLFTMMTDAGHMPADMARTQIDTGMHVQLIAGLLDLNPPAGVTPVVPNVRLHR